MMEKIKNLIEEIKYGVKNNKVTFILGVFTIVPILVSLKIWEGNAIIGLVVVPIIYRLICNIALWIMVRAGKNERRELFNTISRLSILIGFFILAILSSLLGLEKMGFIEIILVSVLIAYYDVVFLAIIKSVFGIDFSKFDSSSNSYKSVDQLLNNTKTSFNNSDGTKIYQDSSGKTIGRSTYDEKTGETKYWNDKGIYIGKSGKDNSGTEKYWDSELKYKGQSEKNSNGTTSYYDENLKHKGISRDNSNDTTTFLKK